VLDDATAGSVVSFLVLYLFFIFWIRLFL